MSTKWARQRRWRGDPEVGWEGSGAGGTHSISMGRDALTKGVLFSESSGTGCVSL